MLKRVPFLLTGALLALAQAGCSDLGEKVKLQALGQVSAARLDFGTLALNDAATRTVTVRNAGNTDLIGAATVGCAGFTITAGGGPFTLAPGGAMDVTVRFSPANATSYSCILDLGAACPQVGLVGSGAPQTPGAAASILPATLDFGVVPAGHTGRLQFAIRSVGTAPLLVNVVSPCSDFLAVTGAGPASVVPGDSVVVSILFNPLAGGNYACDIATGPGLAAVHTAGFSTSVSFATDVQPIFDGNCTVCHGGTSGLFLDASRSYANLVSATSFGYAPAMRVVPGDTTNSVLYNKITYTGRFGGGMPQGGHLPRSLINTIGAWIMEGARNN